ncbi:Putative ribosome biogenesis GTPase RsgA [Salinivirga cyanobacteriivorans]|uniref:Small ribosomal subunit biogenesis GTPase RsgA n=1 Tax=Salinivirga cyanobacteriivorans TaxID=1307839 RepID=A0A0S2I0B0_9BACT|nr:ribosome small subunit-dependent GTPase A [Salinivirga cyanobacteriivorans]ALO15728.1 Putative ribosome biogenesis GTPase RsgA [Salinivirga cyanobacteriivorans]
MDKLKGVVVKTTGSWHTVKLNSGKLMDCTVRGKFRIKGIRNTNPIAVGDVVTVEQNPNESTGVIVDLDQRKSYIIRKATKLSKQAHIIASNIDQVFVLAAITEPETPLMFIDRVLVTAESYRIPAIIVFNKMDILDEDQKELAEAYKYLYESIEYPVMLISAARGLNLDQIKAKMKNTTSVIVGQSGVGKSTLLNKLQPGLELKIGDISDAHQQGKHTTTFAEMHELDFGAKIIDTPGIRSFGLVEVEREEELSHFFPEIFKVGQNCKFHNCTHIHEPGCAVKDAVENNEIPFTRYENYLTIMKGDEGDKYRKDIYAQ